MVLLMTSGIKQIIFDVTYFKEKLKRVKKDCLKCEVQSVLFMNLRPKIEILDEWKMSLNILIRRSNVGGFYKTFGSLFDEEVSKVFNFLHKYFIISGIVLFFLNA